MTEVHAFTDAELSASAASVDKQLHVTFKGSADSRVMQPLVDLLGKVHDEALRSKQPEVVVDFRALDFMNSSCFKAFVSWIARVQELAPDVQYKIRFVSDNAKHWQRRSLGALSCFAVNLIKVEP